MKYTKEQVEEYAKKAHLPVELLMEQLEKYPEITIEATIGNILSRGINTRTYSPDGVKVTFKRKETEIPKEEEKKLKSVSIRTEIEIDNEKFISEVKSKGAVPEVWEEAKIGVEDGLMGEIDKYFK